MKDQIENLISDIELYEWQVNCLEKWIKNKYHGVINVATGTGKTVFAIAAVKFLQRNVSDNLKVKIVVPKIFLAEQWVKTLLCFTDTKRNEIGLYYGKRKDDIDRKYMIYVLNSARYTISRHILNDFRMGYSVMLVCDECHHYGSSENSKIFDFFPYIEKEKYYSIGLSATPETDNPVLFDVLGKEIYKYDINNAQKTGVVSDYAIFNISLDFKKEENYEYEDLSDRLIKNLIKIYKLKPHLKILQENKFYAELGTLSKKGNDEVSKYASLVLGIIRKRKELVYLSENRIHCAVDLIKRLPADCRIIVFAERISSADRLCQMLDNVNISTCKYHSGLNENARKYNLMQYENGEKRILVSCRALDEGFDIPETNAGILMSATGSVRQRIQRIGRIIRKDKKNSIKNIYYLHIDGTSEEDSILPQNNTDNEGNYVPIFNLYYSRYENRFINDEYDFLTNLAMKKLVDKKVPPHILEEVSNNFEYGSVRGDWVISEAECRLNIENATKIKDINYWIAMLKIIKYNKAVGFSFNYK